MVDFNYYNPANIFFGLESEKKLYDLLKKYGTKSLLVIYSGDFVKTLGIFDCIEDACKQNNIMMFENGEVVPNPKIELVRKLVNLCKENNIDTVIAVGGGSSIDTAKAVAIGAKYEKDVWDFYEGKATPTESLTIGVITTIPASGSEMSNASIMSNGLYKVGVEADVLIPDFTIINPKYTKTLPKYQLSCGIVDIFSHLFERYITDASNVNLTDYLIEGAIKSLLVNTKKVQENSEDIQAISEIMWTASVAHNNMLDTGRIGDWACHRLEHELSAQYNIVHGEGMGIVMIAYVKYLSKIKPEKIAQLANRVFNVDYDNFTKEEMALIVADEIDKFVTKLGLKNNLSALNIDDKKLLDMANRATKNNNSPVGHYYPLDNDKFIEVLKLAM